MTDNNSKDMQVRAIVAAVVGNAMEWYDFVIFGFFATILSKLFFPQGDDRAALLLTLATFGAGFCSRPIGGLFFGLYADRSGRKAALQSVIFLMTIAVAIIAFAPVYATIGLAAPILIVVGRLLQGFATGGEFSSSTSFLIEASPIGRRGFYGSLQMAGQAVSIFFGTLVGIVVTTIFSTEQIHAWAWRLPFIAGLLIGPVGFYIRRHLNETAIFENAEHEKGTREILTDLLRKYPAKLLAAFGTTISATIYFYVILIYMPTYGKTELGLTLSQSFEAQAFGLILLVILTLVAGYISDQIGRRPLLWISNGLFLVLSYPLFKYLTQSHSQTSLAFVQAAFCVSLSGVFGALSSVLAEQFPTKFRSTGLAIPYNVAVMIFGGFAPMIVTWLIGYLNTPIAPAYYLIFGALSGIASAFILTDSYTSTRLD